MLSGRLEGKSKKKLHDLIRKKSAGAIPLIAEALLKIATSSQIREFPGIARSLRVFEEKLIQDDKDLEEAISCLYITLHNMGSIYSEEEKNILRSKGGYLCYPGGFSPLLHAGDFIRKDTVIADLGSGNGLQGLLLQQLYPHKKTIQIELSKEMIRIGKLYQKALGIEQGKIDWINDDIMNANFEEADLIYIYRPARPVEGAPLYRGIAERLLNLDKDVTVFSVADCLAPFIKDRFVISYDDGHLKIMVNH